MTAAASGHGCQGAGMFSVRVQHVVFVRLLDFRILGKMLPQNPDSIRVRHENQSAPTISLHRGDAGELARNFRILRIRKIHDSDRLRGLSSCRSGRLAG